VAPADIRRIRRPGPGERADGPAKLKILRKPSGNR